MTSGRRRTRSRSTSATCGARRRPPASRACCTRCAAWVTSCARRAMTFRRRIVVWPRAPSPPPSRWPRLVIAGRAAALRGRSTPSLRELRPKVIFVSRSERGAGVAGDARRSPPAAPRHLQAQLPADGARRRRRVVRRSTLARRRHPPASGTAAADRRAAVREVAAGKRGESLARRGPWRCARAGAHDARADGSTLQIAKPLTDVDDTLRRLRWILLAVTRGRRRRRRTGGRRSSRAATTPARER